MKCRWVLILVLHLSLIAAVCCSCKGVVFNKTDSKAKDGDSDTMFSVVTPYVSAGSLDILYGPTYSGQFSYIVSTTDLGITSADGFDSSGASKTTVSAVGSEATVLNYYATPTSLYSGKKYYVYILDASSGTFEALSANTASPVDCRDNSHTISDGSTTAHPYYLYVPAEYDSDTSKKWPLVVSINGPVPIPSKENFPAILVYTGYSYVNQTYYNTFLANLAGVVNTVIGSYRVDISHMYAMGYSVGGCLAVELANSYGKYGSSANAFRGVVGIGVSYWVNTANLGNANIWLLYGALDSTYGTGTGGTVAVFNKLPGGTGLRILTELPGKDHTTCFSPVWNSPYVFKWILAN